MNFLNLLHPKIAFLCHLLTQTATLQPNHTILTSSVRAILKAMIDTFFLDQLWAWSEFFCYVGRFLQQEGVLWCWLAGLSLKERQYIFQCRVNDIDVRANQKWKCQETFCITCKDSNQMEQEDTYSFKSQYEVLNKWVIRAVYVQNEPSH